MKHYQKILTAEYEKLKEHNQLYSKSAFSKKIGMSPTHLSQLLNDKRPLTHAALAKIRVGLNVSDKDLEIIFKEIEELANNKKKIRISSSQKVERVELSPYEVSLVCSWEYMAVLALADVKNNSYESSWISNRLNIEQNKAEDIVKCLIKLGLIRLDDDHFYLERGFVKTTDDIPSKDIRSYHRGALEKTIDCIESVPVDQRTFSALTFACDAKDLKKINKAVNQFKDKISKIAKKGESLDRVYQLSIQCVPLDQNT